MPRKSRPTHDRLARRDAHVKNMTFLPFLEPAHVTHVKNRVFFLFKTHNFLSWTRRTRFARHARQTFSRDGCSALLGPFSACEVSFESPSTGLSPLPQHWLWSVNPCPCSPSSELSSQRQLNHLLSLTFSASHQNYCGHSFDGLISVFASNSPPPLMYLLLSIIK